MLTPSVQPTGDLFHESLIQSYVDSSRFVERSWLEVRVMKGLDDPACRFVLLTAEPGAGKTTFMAWLASRHTGWLRYFIRRDQRTPLGDAGAHSFLLQLGFQLAVHYPDLFHREQVKAIVAQRVGTVADGGQVIGAEIERIFASPFYQKVVEIQQHVEYNQGSTIGLKVGEWVTDPRLLSLGNLQFMALIDPATALKTLHPEIQLVILVDALDELRYRIKGETLLDWLVEVPELPSNIRFVLTSRNDEDLLRRFRGTQQSRLLVLNIQTDDSDVQKDVSHYARSLANEPEVNDVLTATQGVEQFVEQAIKKANGNLGYLAAVGRAVDRVVATQDRQALERLLDLSQLPEELQGLYAFFLEQIKDSISQQSVEVKDPKTHDVHYLSAWPAVYRRILGVLGVAREPLTLSQVQALGGIRTDEAYVAEAINRLSQFLDREDDHYRLYHTTLLEFLTAEATQQNPATRDLAVQASDWHRRIADYYWQTYHEEWSRCDTYGLNSLAFHLFKSGEFERLSALITKAWLNARYVGSKYTYGGFLADVDLAWQAVATPEASNLPILVRLQVARYVVNQQVNVYTDTDLEILVWLGRAEEALAYARLRSDSLDRFNSVLAIYDVLKRKGQTSLSLLDEGHQAATSIVESYWRTEALRKLATALTEAGDNKADQVFDEARRASDSIQETSWQVFALMELVIALAQARRFDEARKVARSLQDGRGRVTALRNLSTALAQVGDGRANEVFDEASKSTDNIQNEGERAAALEVLAIALAEAGRFNEARRIVNNLQDDAMRARAQRSLVVALAERKQFDEAWEVGVNIQDTYWQALALQALAANLAQAGDGRAGRVFNEAYQMAESIQDPYWQVIALSDLITILVQAGEESAGKALDKARQTVSKIQDTYWQTQAQRHLAAGLAQAGYQDDAHQVALAIEDDEQQALALRDLVKALAQTTRYDGALQIARTIHPAFEQAEALRDVAMTMAQTGDSKADSILSEVVEISSNMQDDQGQAAVLQALVAALAQLGHFHEAALVAAGIPYPGEQAVAWWTLSTFLAQFERFDEARQVADIIQNTPWRVATLRDLAAVMSQNGEAKASEAFHEAYQAAQSIQDAGERITALRDLAAVMSQNGEAKASEAFHAVRQAVQNIQNERDRVVVLIDLTLALIQAREAIAGEALEEVRQAVRSMQDPYWQPVALRDFTAALAQAGRFDEAHQEAKSIQHPFFRASALQSITTSLAEMEHFDEAYQMADSIQDPYWQAMALLDLATILAQAGEENAGEVLDKAYQVTGSIQEAAWKPVAMRSLVAVLAQAERLDEARRTADTIEADEERAKALQDLATAQAQAGHFAEALSSLRPRVLDEFLRILAEWAPYFEQVQPGLSIAVLREATGVAEWVRQDWRRIHILLAALESSE